MLVSMIVTIVGQLPFGEGRCARSRRLGGLGRRLLFVGGLRRRRSLCLCVEVMWSEVMFCSGSMGCLLATPVERVYKTGDIGRSLSVKSGIRVDLTMTLLRSWVGYCNSVGNERRNKREATRDVDITEMCTKPMGPG